MYPSSSSSTETGSIEKRARVLERFVERALLRAAEAEHKPEAGLQGSRQETTEQQSLSLIEHNHQHAAE